MNIFFLSLVSSYSIVLAVIIGLVRFQKTLKTYQPFVILCIVALCNELISLLMLRLYNTNAVNANFYTYIELILFIWQFRKWGSLNKTKWHLTAVVSLMSLIWIYDNLIWNQLNTFNSLFRICYSFLLIFLAINQINQYIISTRTSLLTDSRFLICFGVIIYYSYKATIEVFYLLKLQFSDSFYDNIYYILLLINLFVNLIYALAILWIPTKQKFILPY